MAYLAPEDGRAFACTTRLDRFLGSRRRKIARALGVTVAAIALSPASAIAVDRDATPSTFASVFSSAAAGDTIRLASGSYGNFRGALKSGTVTITAQPGDARLEIGALAATWHSTAPPRAPRLRSTTKPWILPADETCCPGRFELRVGEH